MGVAELKAFLAKLWPRRPSAPPSPSRPLPYSRLTLDDWRSSPERVAYAAELLKQPLFLDLLGMLANVRVHSRGPVDSTAAAILLGQRIGQDTIISALLSAATLPAPPPGDLPPADYAAENVMAAWEREGDMTDRL